jgi:hypothetical protein
MPLTYLWEDCHKQAVTHIRESLWFESIYTLPGKTRPTRHVRFPRQSMYVWRTLPAGSPHTLQPFTLTQQSWTYSLLPRKSAPDSTSQPGWVVHGTRLSFSPNTAIEAVRLSQISIDNRLLGLPVPYHRHTIGTFNTCPRVPTSRSLTYTAGSYHIENFRIGTAFSPPFHSEGSTDPPK